jgi:hypothetical protein
VKECLSSARTVRVALLTAVPHALGVLRLMFWRCWIPAVSLPYCLVTSVFLCSFFRVRRQGRCPLELSLGNKLGVCSVPFSAG